MKHTNFLTQHFIKFPWVSLFLLFFANASYAQGTYSIRIHQPSQQDQLYLLLHQEKGLIAAQKNNPDSISSFEMQIECYRDELRSFQSQETGKYLCAMKWENNFTLQQNRDHWEGFTIIKQPNGRSLIKTVHDTFLYYPNVGSDRIEQTQNADLATEFEIISHSTTFIRTADPINPKYLILDKEAIRVQLASLNELGGNPERAQLLINNAHSNSFNISTPQRDQFLCAMKWEDEFKLQPQADHWEQFEFINLPDGSFIIKTAHETYLSQNAQEPSELNQTNSEEQATKFHFLGEHEHGIAPYGFEQSHPNKSGASFWTPFQKYISDSLSAAGAYIANQMTYQTATLLGERPADWIANDVYKVTLNDGKIFTLRIYNPGSFGTKIDRDIFLDALKQNGRVEETAFAINQKVDINLHIEQRGWTSNGKRNIMMANQEFVNIHDAKQMHKVLCRNRACYELLAEKRDKHSYSFELEQIKFSSKVKESPEPGDFSRFFHPAGKSPHKNTDHLIATWLEDKNLPQLVVTCFESCAERLDGRNLLDKAKEAGNITLHTERLAKDVFEKYRNIGNVIIPSSAEGYGHSINEARFQQAVILTMDYPPMNELIQGEEFLLLRPIQDGSFASGAQFFTFDQQDLKEKVKTIAKLNDETRRQIGKKNRERFEQDTLEFYQQFTRIISESL